MFKTTSLAVSMVSIVCAATKQLQASAIETTKLVVEVSRHGARASETIYPFTVNDPYDNF